MFAVSELDRFATALLHAAGLLPRHARQVAEILLTAECFGHSSHGLSLLPRYLTDLSKGVTNARGEVRCIRDGRSVLVFDAGNLPGPVAVLHALDLGLERVSAHGTVSIVIRNSGHVACLGAYLERATRRGVIALIMSSNPTVNLVAPHGGVRPVYSPDPIAFGFPTSDDPVLIDFSTSAVAANACRLAAERGERLSGAHLKLLDGTATDDPAALFATPPAALMPLGGADLGHKGFGLALMVEMLTSGLAGEGRSSPGVRPSNTTFINLIDPECFGGAGAMTAEASWLVQACRESGDDGDVRLPGERALSRRRTAMAEGLSLPDTLVNALGNCARERDVAPLQRQN